tara:strand:+ start:620 stop:1498 length:879 start_codon:yes stop_codon:yes gene_type:complete
MSEEAQVTEQATPVEAPVESTESVSQEQVSESSWRDSLPEDIRDHKSISHFTDVGALAKSYMNAQSMIGKDKIVIPGQSATEEEWRETYTKLGLPATSSEYQFDSNAGLGENMEVDENLIGWFKEVAHKVGLNNSQAQSLIEQWNANNSELASMNEETARQSQEASAKQLRQEWGQAYDNNLAMSQNVIDKFFTGDKEALFETSLADGTRLGDNAEFIKMMASVGEFINSRIGEDSIDGLQGTTAYNPTQLEDELKKLQDLNGPYGDKKHPEHDSYVRKVSELYEQLYPETQ